MMSARKVASTEDSHGAAVLCGPLGRLPFILKMPLRGAYALFCVTDVIRSPSGRLPRLLTFMGCVARTRPLVSGKARP